ncbi:hypothetical protein ONZ51_g13424 [Trametes cubensis]|uniref:Uncharacterized protein n=1 Tax=Trametes cubensis TaxID=1111947 RepID=A0AAD7TEG2_9APHY|nr:hypothetical protein ONZ51_g13424 [Trametes cubensis]
MADLRIEFFDCGTGPRYTSSTATRNRRKTKRKNKGGKPGNPGSFSEGRLALFEEYQPEFNKLTKLARTSQNEFWSKFLQVYWARFPYTVPLREEPSDSTWPLPNEDAFTDKEREEKGRVIKKTVSAIKRHFRYVRERLEDRENPWAEFLVELKKDTATPPAPPRQLAIWQLYMSKKNEEIDRALAARCLNEEISEDNMLAERSDIARGLLAKETAEYREALQLECEQAIEADRAEYEAEPVRQPPIPSDQQRARDKLAVVVQPLLNLIREHTGYYLTLIAGYPLEDQNQLQVLNAGKTAGPVPVCWHLVDLPRFKKDVMGCFTNFLARTEEGLARSTSVVPGLQTSTASTSPAPSTVESTMLASQAVGAPSPALSSARDGANVPSAAGRGRGGGELVGEDFVWDSGSSSDSDSSSSSDEEEEGRAGTPDPDVMGLTEPVKRQLATCSARARRAELFRMQRLSPWDRETLCARVGAADMLASIAGISIDIPLRLDAPAVVSAALKERSASGKTGGAKAKGKGRADALASPSSSATGSHRTSSRLAARAQIANLEGHINAHNQPTSDDPTSTPGDPPSPSNGIRCGG